MKDLKSININECVYNLVKIDSNTTFNENIIKSFGKNYKKCFDNNINIEKLKNNNDINFILTNKEYTKVLFYITLQKYNTDTIVLWNICKNLDCKISGYHIIESIINNYIKNNNIEFPNIKFIRLVLKCNNPFIIPSLKTYCRLGFKINDENVDLLGWTTIKHVTMERLLYNPIFPKDFIEYFNNQLNILIKKCEYDDNNKKKIYDGIDKRTYRIDFRKN